MISDMRKSSLVEGSPIFYDHSKISAVSHTVSVLARKEDNRNLRLVELPSSHELTVEVFRFDSYWENSDVFPNIPESSPGKDRNSPDKSQTY